jgi:type IV secretory pathway VirB10-like protein
MDKKYLWVIFLVISGIIIIVTSLIITFKQLPKEVKEVIITKEDRISSDFFTLPKQEDVPAIVTKESIPEPDANEIFKSVKPIIDVAKLAEERRLNQLQEERKKSLGDASGIIFNKLNSHGQYEGEISSYDKDFSAHNIDTTIATYPVNLERVLTADRMIEAILTTEIKSEIASQKVKAQVVRDVYGSHGNKILIPWGTVVLGRYMPLKKDGDTRLNIEWYRMITPNGINIKLLGEVADATGSAGLTGDVDDRFKEKYGSAMLLATISAAGQMVVPVGKDIYQSAANSYSEALSNVTAEAIKKSFDLLPKVQIKRGERLYISPLQDIHFKQAKGNVIEVEPVDYEKTYREEN